MVSMFIFESLYLAGNFIRKDILEKDYKVLIYLI